VKIPDQGPLCGTFDEVVDALRIALHYVDSRLWTDERSPSSDDWLGE